MAHEDGTVAERADHFSQVAVGELRVLLALEVQVPVVAVRALAARQRGWGQLGPGPGVARSGRATGGRRSWRFSAAEASIVAIGTSCWTSARIGTAALRGRRRRRRARVPIGPLEQCSDVLQSTAQVI